MTPLSAEDPSSIGGYTLLGRLGAGGMGVVYLGVSASGRQVAVKFVRGSYAEDEEFRGRFRQEVAAARRVSGAFTAPVVDADPEADRPWMATLYVPGLTLAEVVAKEGPLSLRDLRGLGLGLAEALERLPAAGTAEREKLAKSARAAAGRMKPETYMDKLLMLYKQVAGQKKGR